MSVPGPIRAAGDPRIVYEAFDQLPIMIYVVTGADLVYAAGNAACRTWMGDRDFLGLPAREVFPEVSGQRIWESYARVYATGEPEAVTEWRILLDLDVSGETQEIFADVDFAPLRDPAGSVFGVMAYFSDVTSRVRQRQHAEARAVELERRYRAAREVVAELQTALLPPGLPVLPGVEVAASYVLADADTVAGGDWFDAFALTDGAVALIVGDVVGHGVAASATMGQLRVVLHERLHATSDVIAALEAVDAWAAAVPGGRAATVCVAVLDPDTGRLSYCTAGHPPPLVVSADADARYLPPSGSGPLGVGSSYQAGSDVLGPGEMLLLYTDGILERPGRKLTSSTLEFAQVAADAAADRIFEGAEVAATDRLTTQTLEVLTRTTGHSDDITLLAVARRPPAADLHLTLSSAPAAIPVARAAVDDWTTSIGTGEEDRVALEHAVVELVTNAYEHAPPDPASRALTTITVTANLSRTGELRLAVADNGRWREPSPSRTDRSGRARGFGLAMTRSLVDGLAIDHSKQGTSVIVIRKATRAARLLTSDRLDFGRPAKRPVEPQTLRIVDHTHHGSDRIALFGPLDASTVEDLGEHLDHLSRGGTRRLTVDLTGVTHLASAAVAELHRTALDASGHPLTLFAPPGSPAHHVLSLVNLPHTTIDPDLGKPSEDVNG